MPLSKPMPVEMKNPVLQRQFARFLGECGYSRSLKKAISRDLLLAELAVEEPYLVASQAREKGPNGSGKLEISVRTRLLQGEFEDRFSIQNNAGITPEKVQSLSTGLAILSVIFSMASSSAFVKLAKDPFARFGAIALPVLPAAALFSKGHAILGLVALGLGGFANWLAHNYLNPIKMLGSKASQEKIIQDFISTATQK
ncbi:Uncharacterised protein [Candidatus Anstonella stagnisolia]|nr:Uncharacterised protein [Candidatus Anstonella stagnisolia]